MSEEIGSLDPKTFHLLLVAGLAGISGAATNDEAPQDSVSCPGAAAMKGAEAVGSAFPKFLLLAMYPYTKSCKIPQRCWGRLASSGDREHAWRSLKAQGLRGALATQIGSLFKVVPCSLTREAEAA